MLDERDPYSAGVKLPVFLYRSDVSTNFFGSSASRFFAHVLSASKLRHVCVVLKAGMIQFLLADHTTGMRVMSPVHMMLSRRLSIQ